MKTHIISFSTYLVAGLFGMTLLAACGSMADRVADAAQRGVERATEREVERGTDRATTQVIRGAENAVRCSVGDRACAERARRRGEDIVYVDEDGNEVEFERNAPDNPSAHYAFTPGNRVIFEDDFSGTPVGDFPHRLHFTKGAMEVVDWSGEKLLMLEGNNQFEIPLPETLPDQFTLEFDIHDRKSAVDPEWTAIYFARPPQRGFTPNRPGGSPFLRFGHFYGAGLHATNSNQISGVHHDASTSNTFPALDAGLLHVEVQVDGEAVKVYANRERIVNVPNVNLGRHNAITFQINASTDPTYIGNVRVAAGGQDLYSTLQSEGRVTTRGILFQSGNAVIQEGSEPILAEIARMLHAHPELRLQIEGHTDNTGSSASNLTLSRNRALAVRDYLIFISPEAIDASRLEAVGMGEDRPVADNNTEEGRRKNRRVELVRL